MDASTSREKFSENGSPDLAMQIKGIFSRRLTETFITVVRIW